MDELKNKSPAREMLRGDFPVKNYRGLAIEKYIDVPNLMTSARHAALQDETPLYCLLSGNAARIDFLVPKQALDLRLSQDGHQYCILTVLKKNENSGKHYKLVICQDNFTGFLLENIAL